jgi:hypothetical protein
MIDNLAPIGARPAFFGPAASLRTAAYTANSRAGPPCTATHLSYGPKNGPKIGVVQGCSGLHNRAAGPGVLPTRVVKAIPAAYSSAAHWPL